MTSSAPSSLCPPSLCHAGIDVAKLHLDLHLHPQGLHRRFANTRQGRKDLLAHLAAQPAVALVVMEASGGYERAILQTLRQAGLPVALVQPARVHAFIRAMGQHAKTDRLDAKALALFAAAGLVGAGAAMPAERLALRDLTRTLESLRREKARLSTMREKLDDPGRDISLQRIVDSIEAEEKLLLSAIDTLIAAHPHLKALVECLQTMPGIGRYTACILAGELPELGTCSKAAIAAIAGLAPYVRQSGQWVGKASIRGGRHHPRRALYMAALTATRFNPDMKAEYQKLRDKGKPFKVAITAIMRQMLVALNAMAKNNTPWQINA